MLKFYEAHKKQKALQKALKEDWQRSEPTLYPIQLSNNERAYLTAKFKKMTAGGGRVCYLEFGSGGSTFLATLYSDLDITSVESSMQWIEHITQWEILKNAIALGRLHIEHIDIGEVGDWGIPINDEKRAFYPEYSQRAFSFNKDFKLVFIDGRFRVACVLATLSHCAKDTTILVHDFNNRPQYHRILEFVDIVDTCDTLAEFKIKDHLDKQRVQQVYEEFKYDCY